MPRKILRLRSEEENLSDIIATTLSLDIDIPRRLTL